MKQIYFKKKRPNTYFASRLPKSLRLTKKKHQLKLLLIFSSINFILIIYLLFFSNYFFITQIEVRGVRDIPQNFIIQFIQNQEQRRSFLLGKQTNLILFNQKEAIAKISQIVVLKQINIKKSLPNKIIVEIEEKKPALVWIINDKFYYLDQTGTVIREVNFFSINPYLPIIRSQISEYPIIGQRIIETTKINFIFNLLKQVPQEIKISSLEVLSPKMEVLTLKSKAGWQAIFDPAQSLEDQLNNLTLILKNKSAEEIKKIDYFDLRLPDRVYYKE
jgi:cell division protein FtsQ